MLKIITIACIYSMTQTVAVNQDAIDICQYTLISSQLYTNHIENYSADIPLSIKELINNYPETAILIQYYKEMMDDPDYFKKKIDISKDLATDDVPLFLQWDKRWAFLNMEAKL